MFGSGRGVGHNDQEAARWYKKAADQGFAEAQCNLGLRYVAGRGVTHSHAEAARWLRKAADQ